MYLLNINQIWVVFILFQFKFSLIYGYVKYVFFYYICLTFVGVQKYMGCYIFKIIYLGYRNKIWVINSR